eukprot:Gb_04027 [translate_table: standard]
MICSALTQIHKMAYSWRVTVFTQVAMSLALFMFLFIAKTQRPTKTSPLDLYFISVGGGPRPLAEQRTLAKQMEATARKYGVEFVLSIDNRGANDRLLTSIQEGVHNFPSLQVPWYTNVGSHEEQGYTRYFRKQISIPFQHTMDIINIDTTLLEDSIDNISSENGGWDQLEWLKETLSESHADWRIVIGWHPLKSCRVERNIAATQRLHNLLSPIFIKYGVHIYLHGHEEIGQYFQDKGIAYIGIPLGSSRKYSYVLQNETCFWAKDMHNGFILHRVSPLEMEFYFMDSKGTILHRATLHQSGRAVL